MKFGVRKPSLKRSFKARTTGRWKRAMKRAVIPGYGRRGMGWLHPKRAMYNRVYRRTTVSVWDIGKVMAGTGHKRRSPARRRAAVPVAPAIDWLAVKADVERRIALLPEDKQVLLESDYTEHEISKKTVFLLWLFTGFLGGHRFYLHDYGLGIFTIILVLLFHWYALAWIVFDGLLINSRVTQGNILMKKALLETMEDEILNSVLTPPSVVAAQVEQRQKEEQEQRAQVAATPVTATEAVAATLPKKGNIDQFYPPDTEKFQMNEAEKIFFRNFFVYFAALGLAPHIAVNRMSDGTLNFCYEGKQIGRVRLQKKKHTMQLLSGDDVQVIEGELPAFLEQLPVWMGRVQEFRS